MTMVGISSNNIHSQSIVMDSSNEQNVAAMIAATQRFSNKTTVEQELVNASLVKTFNPKHVAAAGASIVLPLIDANKLTLVAGVGGADPQRHSDNMSP